MALWKANFSSLIILKSINNISNNCNSSSGNNNNSSCNIDSILKGIIGFDNFNAFSAYYFTKIKKAAIINVFPIGIKLPFRPKNN